MTGMGFCGPMTAMGTLFDAKEAETPAVATGPMARTGESGWSSGLPGDIRGGWAEQGWWVMRMQMLSLMRVHAAM